MITKSFSKYFKFIAYCKDGKIKYSVENFVMSTQAGSSPLYYGKTSLEDLKPPPPYNVKEKQIKSWKSQTEEYLDRQVKLLISDFVRSMKIKKNDDW